MLESVQKNAGLTGSALELGLPRAGGRWMSTGVATTSVGVCLLMALGAHARVPIPGSDVPMTLQLLAVLLAGFALPPARAVAGMLLYLACGTAGMPVFAPGSGGLLGPTGGYIVGFVVAVGLLSVLRGGRSASLFRLFLAAVAAAGLVLAFGVAWRTVMFAGDLQVSVTTGLLPFIPKALVEVLLAVAVIAVARRGGRVGTTSLTL